MRLVDTHVHINFDSFDVDRDDVAAAWREAGVAHLVHSCVDPSEFEKIQAIAQRYPEISFAVGLHPLDMDKWSDTTAEEIRYLAQSDARVVAIGEMGLDFFKADDKAIQKAAFVAQLEIAQSLNLPVIIHCREAAEEMAVLLETFFAQKGSVRGVMHCWTGSPEETQRFLNLGFFISFSGIVTFKNSKQVKASAKMVPSDRILVETDCPFLSPVPKRKEKRNQPAFVRHVAEYVAELREIPLATFAQQTTRNAQQLFSLPTELLTP
ncbi:hydrolase, TatD family [Synechococcus sp. PCC 7335]|uniref:TatD family hydrolase n=1 Tax=Synechococcus sp. (strain ATCC 29403 / PCC 7335) TaxID=91464 RepID=UPI00017EBC3E|nr:TatD family hydrolase [Synechococcus sp. PCC 7335]EDX83722.1 hydrolase, TatD family [Synechococcus sp. PCC 7335]